MTLKSNAYLHETDKNHNMKLIKTIIKMIRYRKNQPNRRSVLRRLKSPVLFLIKKYLNFSQ